MTCQYHFAEWVVCNEPIYAADDSPSGYRHSQGERQLCHWASPTFYGPQDSKAVIIEKEKRC